MNPFTLPARLPSALRPGRTDCRCYPRLASMTAADREAMKAQRIALGVHATYCPMYVDRSPSRPGRVGQLESLR